MSNENFECYYAEEPFYRYRQTKIAGGLFDRYYANLNLNPC